jgi:hypothetical protein
MKSLRCAERLVVCALLLLALALPVSAQTPREARLIVTVIDPSGGVIPAATVVVGGVEESTRTAGRAAAKTSEKGVATLESLPPDATRFRRSFRVSRPAC